MTGTGASQVNETHKLQCSHNVPAVPKLPLWALEPQAVLTSQATTPAQAAVGTSLKSNKLRSSSRSANSASLAHPQARLPQSPVAVIKCTQTRRPARAQRPMPAKLHCLLPTSLIPVERTAQGPAGGIPSDPERATNAAPPGVLPSVHMLHFNSRQESSTNTCTSPPRPSGTGPRRRRLPLVPPPVSSTRRCGPPHSPAPGWLPPS